MLVPNVFRGNFVDNFFDDFFKNSFEGFDKKVPGMTADIREFDDRYQMDIELAGYSKEDIKAELKDGYLTISANHQENNDEQDEKGRYIRRERYYGLCQRSFFVGNGIKEEDIHASFTDGVLRIDIPKNDKTPVEEKHYIAIEG